LPLTALLANAAAATVNLLRTGWLIPRDINAQITDRAPCFYALATRFSHQDQEGGRLAASECR